MSESATHAPDPAKFVPAVYSGSLEPMYYCRAWNPRREKYCRARAGAGTEHRGVGRCWIHDGGADKQVRHGLRRRYQSKSTRVLEFIERQAADPAPLDLLPDLALARALLQEWLERDDTDPADGMKLVAEVTRIVERIEGINAKNYITYGQLKRFLFMVKQLLELHVSDEGLRRKIFGDLATLSIPY
jgi:hypothetical protein